MTPLQIAQLASAVLVVATPWIVVRIAFRVAHAHIPALQHPMVWPSAAAWLSGLTLAGVVSIAAAALAVVAPFWLSLAAGLEFVVLSALALRSLAEIDRVSKSSRELSASLRAASLDVRRVDHYLPWRWRLGLYALAIVGVATFAWRLTMPGDGRQLLKPALLAGAAIVFLWLYETWIHGLVFGPVVTEAADDPGVRGRFIRRIFAMEVALVTGFLAAAHALLDLDWQIHGGSGAAIALSTAVLGIVGCALAVSSDFTRRHYASVRRL